MNAQPARYGIVGSGWRTGFFQRLARLMPARFAVTGVVTRTAERGAEVTAEWGVPTFRTVGELLAADRPDFVIVSVPWALTPVVTTELVGLDMPVLAETPPAPDVPGLRSLWSDVGASGLVQVAEQYMMMPGHDARLRLARSGALGTITSVQVSSTHLYHAVSMIRSFVEAGFADTEVVGRAFTAPLVDPLEKSGWRDSAEASPQRTELALLDFGSGRSGVYDFTANQWWNPLRTSRIVVRGSHGELVDDRVTRLLDPHTPAVSTVERRHTGIDLNLEGFDLDFISWDGTVLYRNPFVGARLADDDLAVAHLLERTGAWARGDGPAPYPLAEACQDHLLGLAIQESIATGAPVRTTREPWAG